jgi:hypothetical protein
VETLLKKIADLDGGQPSLPGTHRATLPETIRLLSDRNFLR